MVEQKDHYYVSINAKLQYVQEHDNAQYICAFDVRSLNTVWKTL